MARRQSSAPDDQQLFVVKRDLSGGQNTRQFEQVIGDTQAVKLQNILLETAGSRSLRLGQTLVDRHYLSILTDGDFEVWTDSSTLTNWTNHNATLTRSTTPVYEGTYSAKVTYAGSNCNIDQSYSSYASVAGLVVTFGSWVWCYYIHCFKILVIK
jgi:hypothetical protein